MIFLASIVAVPDYCDCWCCECSNKVVRLSVIIIVLLDVVFLTEFVAMPAGGVCCYCECPIEEVVV